jgi:AraC family transcriptional regulator
MMWAGMNGLLGPGTRMIGIVHDDPQITPSDKLRYDAAITVSRPAEPRGEFGTMELAGGRYAAATHRGSYESLSGTYERLYGGWLPRSGEEPRDAPAFEEYLNSPQNTEPDDLLTRIWLPLK